MDYLVNIYGINQYYMFREEIKLPRFLIQHYERSSKLELTDSNSKLQEKPIANLQLHYILDRILYLQLLL
jgi:hypothetical protein